MDEDERRQCVSVFYIGSDVCRPDGVPLYSLVLVIES